MAGPDLSSITAVIDFGTIQAAVLLTFSALVVVYVVLKGVLIFLKSVGGVTIDLTGTSSNLSPQSRESYAHDHIVTGEYVPRQDFELWMARHPELKDQGRRYARRMARNW